MTSQEMNPPGDSGSRGFSYSYEGVCDNNAMVSFTEYLTASFDPVMSPQEFKTVLFCSNELLQNMGFYSAETETAINQNPVGKGKFNLSVSDTVITMISENRVVADQFEILSKKLDQYNSLSSDELKALYKQKLREESPADSKGGGIGFIEIARKSKNKIHYSINKDNSHLLLKLQITLTRIKTDE